jgi:hypothetical protein
MNRSKKLSLRMLIVLMFVMFSLPIEAAKNDNRGQDAAKFSGIWKCDDESGYQGKCYLKIIKEKSGRFKFITGFKNEDKDKISWVEPMLKDTDGIYLKLSKGKLKGEFVSYSFYATHGEEYTYKITLDLISNNKLLYSVYSSIRGETEKLEATKISE